MIFGVNLAALYALDERMDEESNSSSNGTTEFETPRAELLDYAEIIFLVFMVIIGGPLNMMCFYRSNGWCLKAETSAPPGAAASIPRGYQGRRRNSNWKPYGTYSTRSLGLRLHLTAANLFIILVYGISQICWLWTYTWLAGDYMCRLVKFFHTFCFYLTSNIIVMIALDRVYVTRHIDRPPNALIRPNERWLRLIVRWAPWVLAVISSAPQLFVWNVIAPYDELPDW